MEINHKHWYFSINMAKKSKLNANNASIAWKLFRKSESAMIATSNMFIGEQ